MIDFNVNDYVLVKLTDHGRALHAQDHAEWTAAAGITLPYHPPREDAEGWSEWQLWGLMRLFGQVMVMGCEMPFETAIRLKAE